MRKRTRLRGLRAEKSISQLDLAAATKISVARYWRIENGYADPTSEEREAIAQQLDTNASDLFREAVAS